MQKLECGMARDWLAPYYDGLLSGDIKTAVKEHLVQCESCREAFDALSAQRQAAAKEQAPKAHKDQNYQRKMKKKPYVAVIRRGCGRHNAIRAVCRVCLAVLFRRDSGYWPEYATWYERFIDEDKVIIKLSCRDQLDARANNALVPGLHAIAAGQEPKPVLSVEEITVKDKEADKTGWAPSAGNTKSRTTSFS